MDLKKVGSRNVSTVTRDTPLVEAARIMRENHVGDVIVVDERDGLQIPVGIVTDRDIVMATVALGAPTDPLLAGDVMSGEITVMPETSGLARVIEVMKDNGVKRVPLVNERQELVGVIALEDIMQLLSEELSALTKVAQRQKLIESLRRQKLA